MKPKIFRAGIAGSSGYTGYELIRLIHRHPQLRVAWLTSESSAGQKYRDIYPVHWDYPLISLQEALARTDEVDVVFLCLPHAASIEPVRAFYEAGVRVIDLSADFRLTSAAVYERWYDTPHGAPDLLNEAVYGLCEVYREAIRGARLIANPGCYPTSVNLALYPLAKAGWLTGRVIVDAKSGVTGAGRKAKLLYSFAEANENLTPYNVGYRHRHVAEMEQVLHGAGATNSRFTFSPHLLPVNRGILSTIYVSVPAGIAEDAVRRLYAETYAGEPFIHLLPPGECATLRHSVHTNLCTIGITPENPRHPDGPDYVITASIDNLLKGASGQAVQNFNISVGLDEPMGLI
jgi:N-acetyl-gamma-glutamyl-phosphate reductase